jgi:hypothetical protein
MEGFCPPPDVAADYNKGDHLSSPSRCSFSIGILTKTVVAELLDRSSGAGAVFETNAEIPHGLRVNNYNAFDGDGSKHPFLSADASLQLLHLGAMMRKAHAVAICLEGSTPTWRRVVHLR